MDKNSEILNQLLRLVAPGTLFREGLENVLRARTGALIVVGSNQELIDIVDGGFSIDCEFTPHFLYELAKMDGAVIVHENFDRILYANTQLVPHATIPSTATGIRHRTAERVAKQTGNLVVSISQRRRIITIYKGNIRYVLKEIGTIITKANQAIHVLEKYCQIIHQSLINLTANELEEGVNISEVSYIVQQMEMAGRVKLEIQRYIDELGTEGRLIQMQLDKLIRQTFEEHTLLLADYAKEGNDEKVMKALSNCSINELLDINHISRILGYTIQDLSREKNLFPRGYRVLKKIPRLPNGVILKLLNSFKDVKDMLSASIQDLHEVEGIGEIRARSIKKSLQHIQEQAKKDIKI